MSSESAPNWDLGQVLTWSGKWHIAYPNSAPDAPNARGLCGAYGYTRDHVPRYVGRLQGIAKGYKTAPVCKKCERAAQSNEAS